MRHQYPDSTDNWLNWESSWRKQANHPIPIWFFKGVRLRPKSKTLKKVTFLLPLRSCYCLDVFVFLWEISGSNKWGWHHNALAKVSIRCSKMEHPVTIDIFPIHQRHTWILIRLFYILYADDMEIYQSFEFE